jgi:hypothetical protein
MKAPMSHLFRFVICIVSLFREFFVDEPRLLNPRACFGAPAGRCL